MTPIDGISNIRRLPRLGKIRLGIKKEGQKGLYPAAVDYFVCPDEVKAVYEEKPTELKVMFPSDDMELIAPQYMKCYSYSQGLICRGDGKTCKRKVDVNTGDFADKQTERWELSDGICDPNTCPMLPAKQCRRVMTLRFILHEVPGLGIYELSTSSFYSIVNINSQLAPGGFLRYFTPQGRIAFIPLVLSVIPQEVNPVGAGRKTVHILSIRADVKLSDIIRISRQRPAQVLLPGVDDNEPPEDLYPGEIIGAPKEETTPEENSGEKAPGLTKPAENMPENIPQQAQKETEKPPEKAKEQPPAVERKPRLTTEVRIPYETFLPPLEVGGGMFEIPPSRKPATPEQVRRVIEIYKLGFPLEKWCIYFAIRVNNAKALSDTEAKAIIDKADAMAKKFLMGHQEGSGINR